MNHPTKLTSENFVNLFSRDGYIYASRSEDGMPKDTADAVIIVGCLEEVRETKWGTKSTPKIVCVNQFRPSVQCHELSLPAGLVEPNESVLEAAKRELLEEAGYEFVDPANLLITPAMTTSSGMSNEKISFVVGEVRKSNKEVKKDENEQISEVLEISVDEMLNNLSQNKYKIPATMLTGLLMVQLLGMMNQQE